MKKYLILSIICVGILSLAATRTPFSTHVGEALRGMLNPSGQFTTLKFGDGTTQTTAGGDLSQVTGILAVTKGGTGTNTATLDGFTHVGTSSFPQGVWGNTGNVGIGSTAPLQKVYVAGNTQTTGEFIEGTGSIVSTAAIIPYIQLSSTVNQIPASTAETLITYTHVDEQQIFAFTPTSGTITIPENGVYVYIAGGQCGKDSGSVQRIVDMWLKKNDVDVPRSSVRNSMNESTDAKVVIQNIGIRCVAGDTIKTYIAVNSTTNNPGLYATTPSVGPVIPSIIVTIFKVSQ